ncbi:hypothetical protein Tco_0580651 [Tanacetum coccineum]
MEITKNRIDERALHKREYDTRVNERQIQTTEGKIDTGNALDARKPVLQPHRNQSVVRQPTAFKSERPRISKPRFASQVDVNNDLSKPVTTHYLPKERESAVVKPHHVIASRESRNSSKNMPRFSSNDMVHNYYLDEARKKTQEKSRNSEPSVMPSAKSQSTANDCKPKPRINNQKSRNWPASKTSYVTTKTVPIAEHSRNSRNFSDSKHFVCSTCQKCVFNANHDQCVTKFLNEVNSHVKVPSSKTTTRNKPWVPIGNIFESSTTKVDSEPLNGSNEDIINPYECEQTLNVSAGTLNLSAVQNSVVMTQQYDPSSQKRFQTCSSPDRQLTSQPRFLVYWNDEYKGRMPTKIELTLEQSQQGVSNDVLAETGSIHNLSDFTKMNSDTEDDIMDPVMQCTTLPSYSSFSQQKLVSFVTEIHTTSIDFLTPKHPSDTYVFIMKMEILLEPASNKLLVDKDFRTNSDIQDLPLRYQAYQGRLLASFQDDAKYEHVGQDTRSQGGKDDQDGRIKI